MNNDSGHFEFIGCPFCSQPTILCGIFAGPLGPASAETGARIIHTLLE